MDKVLIAVAACCETFDFKYVLERRGKTWVVCVDGYHEGFMRLFSELMAELEMTNTWVYRVEDRTYISRETHKFSEFGTVTRQTSASDAAAQPPT